MNSRLYILRLDIDICFSSSFIFFTGIASLFFCSFTVFSHIYSNESLETFFMDLDKVINFVSASYVFNRTSILWGISLLSNLDIMVSSFPIVGIIESIDFWRPSLSLSTLTLMYSIIFPEISSISDRFAHLIKFSNCDCFYSKYVKCSL